MKHADPRRPSQPLFSRTHGLWSLWDMLETWGYRYFWISRNLASSELALIQVSGSMLQTVEPDSPAITGLVTRLQEIEKFAEGEELGAIPGNLTVLQARILAARGPSGRPLILRELLESVERLKNDFSYILHNRYFYSLGPNGAVFYGKPELFGPVVAKKFPKTRSDIEHAGNCLALGEPTACVFHLMRAMESVVRKLGNRLNAQINPKDTWGMILKAMDKGIEALPDKTEKQKRKKEEWSECRAHLWHVKQAWRDNSMHAKTAYQPREAGEILDRVCVFMQHLATL